MYNIYVDIMAREKLSSFQVANMNIIYWPVCSSSKRDRDGVKEVIFSEPKSLKIFWLVMVFLDLDRKEYLRLWVPYLT